MAKKEFNFYFRDYKVFLTILQTQYSSQSVIGFAGLNIYEYAPLFLDIV